jgi:hypothetical protein
MKTTTLLGCLLGLGAGATAFAGCGGGGNYAPVDTGGADAGCGIQSTAVHGVRADGKVDVTAAEAWPSRPAEPAPLTPSEILGACAILSTCFSEIGDAGVSNDADQVKGIAMCVDPKTHPLEERAIPEGDQNERWSFKVRNILAKQGCGGVLIGSKRPKDVYCQEGGCWWTGMTPATVTCEGTVATITSAGVTAQRDCATSYTTCSTTSGTGCTDRPRTACQSAGADRCDGDIKLGCDGCGLVSFHDCGVQGGHCVESSTGVSCVYPSSCTTAPSCSGSMLTFCVGDAPATIDCVALGLAGCENGHCTK